MSGNGANVTKFGIIDGVSPAIAEFVALEIQNATKEFIAQGGPSVVSGVPLYSNTQGKLVASSPYSMPNTLGVAGQVLEVDAGGNIVYGSGGGPPVNPTYLPTLTVTSLSQGPNALSTNYTLPQYPPPIDSMLSNDGTQGFVVNIPATINCQFIGTYSNPLRFSTINIPIPAGDYIPDDLTDIISVALRDSLSSNNVIANIFIGFDPPSQRYGMRLSPGSVDLTSMIWQIYVSGTNDNNVFGLTTGNATVTPLAPGIVFAPDAPLYLNATGDLVWRNVVNNQIESDNGNAVIECSELNGIISYGNYNLNNGSINNIGNINALDNCNITTNTTQIVNGLSELNININSLPRLTQNAIKSKLECGTSRLQLAAVSDLLTDDTTTYFASQNALLTKNMAVAIAPDTLVINQDYGVVNRMVVDDTTTALYSKNALSGPAGSLLELNNDNTFTLGCFAAGNGIIECRPNSLAMYGNTATTAITMTDLNIITSLGVGGRIDREILDTTSQSFRDPTGTERLKIDSDITVNGVYTLPTTAGVDGEVLTRTTGSATTWNRPQIYSIFSQIVDQTVVSTAAETTIIGGGTPTSTLTVPPNFFTAGMVFRYTTGGLFRTSANNISARFRLRNSGILFDSGLLVFSNRVIPATPWNVEATFAYMGGTVMVTNFNFQYNAGNDARGFTSQQSNNTFNAAVSNTLNFTIQWSVSSADNTITTNFGVVQKIY
jgi:hypothetical protein